MSYLEFQEKIEYLKELIDKEATGSPKDLAHRINTSERTLYRLLNFIKEQYGNVDYCRTSNTYYFTEKINIE